MPIQFDWTISLGTAIQTITMVISLVAAWHALKARLIILEKSIEGHAVTLRDHSHRMDRYEERSLELVGDIQRVIGEIGGRAR